MNRIALFLFLLPAIANAQAFDLACIDKVGASVSFTIDPENRIVRVGPMPAKNVVIDSNYINFTLVLGEGEWYHSINRSTGVLSIQGPQKERVPPYLCERAVKRF